MDLDFLLLEETRLQQQIIPQQYMSESAYQQTISVWTYEHPHSSAPSLLQIQQEEKIRERVSGIRMDGRMDEWMDRWMDGQMDG